MSYLQCPRLTFSGRFRSDVPTINNAAGAFDPATARPDQGWNPLGGGAFDLLGCRVRGGERAPGAPLGPADPELALTVVGADDRPSAKLVDLDPSWQSSSQIWGLTVRLVDAAGTEVLRGSYRPAAFRDVGRRQADPTTIDPAGTDPDVNNGQQASASYTSVLDDVVFGAPGAYPALDALREATDAARLSIVFNVFGFYYAHVLDRFATGGLTGALGPWRTGEPVEFVAGRRLDAGRLSAPAGGPPVAIGRGVAEVDPDARRVVVDLGNAYPVDDALGRPSALPSGVAALELGALADERTAVGATLAPADALTLGDYPPAAIDPESGSSGIVALPLDDAGLAAASTRPLALLARRPDGRRVVVSREVSGGLYVRADHFVHRLDAGERDTVTFHARTRGAPTAGIRIFLRPGADADSVLLLPDADPTAATARFGLVSVTTGDDGTATLTLLGADPRNPRGAVDGTVETLAYGTRVDATGQPVYQGTGLDATNDVVVAHVRDAYSVPEHPNWARDVAPVLAPYATLYPIMGQHLADLADRAEVTRWRPAMLLALGREITDPNHMPVTRDLSGPKRATIVRWLEQLAPAPGPPSLSPPTSPTSLTDGDVKAHLADVAAERAITGREA